MKEKPSKPSFGTALLVFGLVLAVLIIGRFVLKLDLHVMMIIALIVAAAGGLLRGYRWADIEKAMSNGIHRAMGSLYILLLIGAIIGSWIHCGAVPAMIYYGLGMISPTIFLPATLLICSIVALATGTSWGTVGTVGIAFMGIGAGLGIPAPMTAGAIVCAASFGDKMSPLSDTTNLAPASVETNIFYHISGMMPVAIPAFLASLVIYFFIGLGYRDGMFDAEKIQAIREGLGGHFNMNPLVMLPVVIVIGLSVAKKPAIPSMLMGVLLASIISMIFQGSNVADALAAINQGNHIEAEMDLINRLLNRGGIQSMLWTFSLVILALSLGGILDETQVMESIIDKLLTKVHSVKGLVAVSMLSTILINAMTAVIYFTLVLNARLFKDSYERMGLERRMLSRSLEEAGTLIDPLIPWTTTGLFYTGILGVSVVSYIPYAFNNWITPILSLVLTSLGLFVFKKKASENTEYASTEEELYATKS